MSPKTVLRSMLLLLAGLSILAVGGCIFDPPSKPPVEKPPETYPVPRTQDALMQNFRRAYDETNHQEYQKVLHENYIFVPLPEDLADLGLSAGEYVLRAQELAITQNIFSGNDISGNPGIQDIDVVLLDQETIWEASTDGQFPAPAEEALYRVEIHFKHTNGYFRVKGQQKFWVLNVPDNEGAHYYLLGQRDFTMALP